MSDKNKTIFDNLPGALNQSINVQHADAITNRKSSNQSVELVSPKEDKKKTSKRTPSKRLSFTERAQKESEELVRNMGGSLELEGGRRTRSSTRGTPNQIVTISSPSPSKKIRKSPASGGKTPPARLRARGRKLIASNEQFEVIGQNDINIIANNVISNNNNNDDGVNVREKNGNVQLESESKDICESKQETKLSVLNETLIETHTNIVAVNAKMIVPKKESNVIDIESDISRPVVTKTITEVEKSEHIDEHTVEIERSNMPILKLSEDKTDSSLDHVSETNRSLLNQQKETNEMTKLPQNDEIIELPEVENLEDQMDIDDTSDCEKTLCHNNALIDDKESTKIEERDNIMVKEMDNVNEENPNKKENILEETIINDSSEQMEVDSSTKQCAQIKEQQNLGESVDVNDKSPEKQKEQSQLDMKEGDDEEYDEEYNEEYDEEYDEDALLNEDMSEEAEPTLNNISISPKVNAQTLETNIGVNLQTETLNKDEEVSDKDEETENGKHLNETDNTSSSDVIITKENMVVQTSTQINKVTVNTTAESNTIDSTNNIEHCTFK